MSRPIDYATLRRRFPQTTPQWRQAVIDAGLDESEAAICHYGQVSPEVAKAKRRAQPSPAASTAPNGYDAYDTLVEHTMAAIDPLKFQIGGCRDLRVLRLKAVEQLVARRPELAAYAKQEVPLSAELANI